MIEVWFTVDLDGDPCSLNGPSVIECKRFIAEISNNLGYWSGTFRDYTPDGEKARMSFKVEESLLPLIQMRYPNAREVPTKEEFERLLKAGLEY